MSGEIDPKDRPKLIRKGNELFNKGEMENAAKIFWIADYRDGLIRVGEYLLYQEKKPFQALLYFKKAKCQKKIDEILGRMFWGLEKWLHQNDDDDTKK